MQLQSPLWLYLTLTLARCSTLPNLLIKDLPPCSLDCLELYVYDYYSSSICSDTTDLDCLCTHSSASGLTLGEAALRCLLSSCTNTTAFQEPAYEVCSGISGALPETHSTLTATLMAATTVFPTSISAATSSPTESVPTSIIYDTSSSATSNAITSSAATSAPTSIRSSTTTSAATAAAAAQTTAAATASAHRSLSGGQVIGIAVGGVATAACAFGFLLLICCSRRRKRQREEEEKDWPNDNDSVANDHPLAPSSTYHHSNIFEYATMVGGDNHAVPPEDQRRSFWRKSIKPEEIGVAVSPEMVQHSPASVTSHNTISQLLPEMPNHSLWPAPLRLSQIENGAMRESKRKSQELSTDAPRQQPRIVSSRTGNGLPTDPRARMYALERNASTNRIPLTPVYDNGLPEDWRQAFNGPARGSRLQVPPASRPPFNADLEPAQNTEHRAFVPPFLRPGPPVPNRASSRYSNTSESTNFEIDDYEYEREPSDGASEYSNPDPRRSTAFFKPSPYMLSPVVESPWLPPAVPSKGIDDPFVSPSRNLTYGQPGPLVSMSPGPQQNPYFPPTQAANPTIRIIGSSPPTKQLDSPKDRLVAEGQSFLVSNGTTPESEDNCSQPSDPSPPEFGGVPLNRTPPPPVPQLQSPFRRQLQPINPINPASRKPVGSSKQPQQHATLSPPDSLLAKRRGSQTTSTMLPTGLKISPDAANRPQPREAPRRPPKAANLEPARGPSVGDSNQTRSIWEQIGRDRYAAASPSGFAETSNPRRPAGPPRNTSSITTSSGESGTAMVAFALDHPMSPAAPSEAGNGNGLRFTPTRRGNGDLFLSVD